MVTKGQFIGRPEVVHAGGPGGVDYELNWRVDRIREGDWCSSAKTRPMPTYRRDPRIALRWGEPTADAIPQ